MKKRFLGILLSFALMLTMMPVLGLSLTAYATTDPALSITSPRVGQVIGNDGKNYDYSSLPQSVDAVAKIAYVDETNHKGLALAMTDESGTKDWNEADTAASAHTPAFTGGTWKLASKAEWENMINAAGGISSLRDGFSSVGGTNMKGMYWSSTPDGAKEYYITIDSGIWYSAPKTTRIYVRACLTFDIATTYPLWVGETQVNSANAANITGAETVTASYDVNSNTLTLNGYAYSGESEGVKYTGDGELKIVLTGTNEITSSKGNGGIYGGNDGILTFSGTGSLSVNSSTGMGAIYTAKDITVESGNVTAEGSVTGVRSESGNVTVNGGTVNAGGNYGIYGNNVTIGGGEVTAECQYGGIYANGDFKITAGTVKATGTHGAGIYASNSATFNKGTIEAIGSKSEVEPTGVSVASGADYYGILSNNVLINEGVESLIASASKGAIRGAVTNKIAGTGWSDIEGTEGKTKIDINTEGQELTDYKKVQFPEKVDPKPEPPKPTPVVNNVPVVNTTAKSSTRTTTIKWTWNAVNGASKYKVAYHKVGSKKWKVKTTKKTKYVLKGQKIKGLYEYKVAAVTASGDVWSDTSCRYFKTVKAKAKFSKGALKVSWKKDKGAAGYEVFIARNKKMDGAQVIQIAPDSRSYKVTGLEKGRYYVKVRPMKNYNGVTYTGILCKAKKVRVK